MVSIVEYNQFIKSWEKYSNEFVDNITKELKLYSPILRKRQEIIQVKSKEHFNIFSAISDVYYRENYNSDILKLILDPHTEDMGDSVYLQQFLEFLKLYDKDFNIKKIGDLKSVYVTREKDKIDLLIHNNKYAIIIESKINNHKDEPNQLVRYYKRTKEKGLSVLKVVYLTITPQRFPKLQFNPNQKTDEMTEIEFENYKKEVEAKLIRIPAVSYYEKDRGKTLKDYLESCANIATTDLARVFILQYAKLLRKTGGDILMLKPEIKLIQEIYKGNESIKNAFDFEEVWEKKYEILAEIYREKFRKEYTALNWVWDCEDEVFLKEINSENDKLYCYSYYEGKKDKGLWQIGFKSNSFTTKTAKEFEEKLKQLTHEGLTAEESGKSRPWVYINFQFNDEPINVFFEKNKNTLEELLKLVNSK